MSDTKRPFTITGDAVEDASDDALTNASKKEVFKAEDTPPEFVEDLENFVEDRQQMES